MFVGWIRQNSFLNDIKTLSQEVYLDENLIIQTQHFDRSMCYAAYEDDQMHALITAFEFENSTLVNGFYYKEGFSDEDKLRLIKLLLKNINSDSTILFMVNKKEKPILEQLNFKLYAPFVKATYNGGAVFNFSNATAKMIANPNYQEVLHTEDKKTYQFDRFEYITQVVMKQSSLLHSTGFGYIHSYALDKSLVKISPFITDDEAFSDAEMLLRGVIYHRGLKQIIAVIPKNVSEITDLYKKYKFELSGELYLMYKNTKPSIELESLYGF